MASAGAIKSGPPVADTAPARPDVFISYAREDKPFVEGTVLPALGRRGKKAWIDLEDIPPAADWRDRVLGGVAAANALIFVLSPDSVTSRVCAEELEHAVALNKRVIPMVRRDCEHATVPPSLARLNWIFLREQDDLERGLEQVIEALETDLEWRDEHSRLAVRTAEWLGRGRDRSFLLRGSDLRDAEAWLARQGEHKERSTPDQTGYILASRQAATRRQRTTLAAVTIALLTTIALAVVALILRNQAIDREELARSRELAAKALTVLPRDPELSVLLAAEAARQRPTAEAEDALRRAEAESHVAVTLRGHRGPAAAVMDPGARLVVSGGHDGTVRVWDGETGRQRSALPGHDARIRGIALSPDGGTIASTDEAGTARLWDRASGRTTAVMRGHRGIVHSPSFSADGRRLLTASLDDGTARIWDTRSGRPLAVLRGHSDLLFKAKFDRGDRRVVTASADGSARVWNARTGRLLALLRGHRGQVNNVTFSPDGSLVATAGQDGTARLWNPRTGEMLHVLRGHTDEVTSVAFDGDSRRLVTTSYDTTAAVWNAKTGRRQSELRDHTDEVLRGTFSPDQALVATASADNTARLWDAGSGEPVAVLRGHTDGVGVPQFSRDGQRLLTDADDGRPRIWRVPQGAQPIRGDFAGLADAVLSPDRSRVLTRSDSRTARLFDARTRKLVREFGTKPLFLATGVAFLPDGRLLLGTAATDTAARVFARDGRLVAKIDGPSAGEIAVSQDGTRVLTTDLEDGEQAHVWDTRTGRLVADLVSEGETVTGGSLSPDGTLAITTTRLSASFFAGRTHAWDTTRGRKLSTLDHHAGFLTPKAAFSPDGRRVVVESLRGRVPVWDPRERRPSRHLRARAQVTSQVVSVAWSPTAELVAAADRTDLGVARIFDPRSGRIVTELRGHLKEVRSVDFSPDGRWLVTASLDKTARVWEVATGRTVAELRGHEGELVGASFADDGRHVITASSDGTARVYECASCASLEQLLAAVPRHVSRGRRLTAAERRTHLP